MNSSSKYQSIYKNIVSQIRDGSLSPGSRISSENEIIDNFGVSNTTARKALHMLEIDGYVRRVKGRGTFVRDSPIIKPTTEIQSFSDGMRQSGLVPSTRVLALTPKTGSVDLHIGGRCYSIDGDYLELKRLRFGNDEAMKLETVYVDMSICPGIDNSNLEQSLNDIYRKQFNIELSRITQTLKSVLLGEAELAYFELAAPAPGLLLQGASFDNSGRLIELEESVYRGDSYSFLVSVEGT